MKKFKAFILMWISLLSASPFKAEAVNASVTYTGVQENDNGFMQGLILNYISYEPGDAYSYHGTCQNVNSCYWSIGFVDRWGVKPPYYASYSYAQANKLVFERGVTGSKITVKDIVIAMNKNLSSNVARLGKSDYEKFQKKLCIGIFITPNTNVNQSVGTLLDNSLYSCSDGSGGGGIEPPPRPPSEEVTCDTLPTIEINHGVLKASSSFQDTKEEKVLLSCSGKATVNFELTPLRLGLGGNITSKLYMDGKAGGATMEVNKQRWVTFRSEISSAQKVSSGVYSNSAILIMTVQ